MQRISRRETNQAIAKLRKDLMVLKKNVVEQKRRIADLEKMNKSLSRQQERLARHPAVQAEIPPVSEEVSIYSRSVKSLRRRFSLTQADLAGLLGVSKNIIAIWEKKTGKLNIRNLDVRKALLDLKKMKKAEIDERLDKTQKKKPAKKKTRKK